MGLIDNLLPWRKRKKDRNTSKAPKKVTVSRPPSGVGDPERWEGFSCYHHKFDFMRCMAMREGEQYRIRPRKGHRDWFEPVDKFEEQWELGQPQGEIIFTKPGKPASQPCPVCDASQD